MQLPPPLPPASSGPPPLPVRPFTEAAIARKKLHWGWISLVSGIIILAATGGGLLIWQQQQKGKLPPLINQSTEEKYAEASAAYNHPDFSGTDPAMQGIRALFDRIGKGRATGNTSDLVDCVDLDREMSEIERRGFAVNLSSQYRADYLKGMKQGLTSNMARLASRIAWNRYKICHVRMLPGGREAVVYLYEVRRTGFEAKIRFWVRKEAAVWRYYDVEDLDSGNRDSTTVGMAARDSYPGGMIATWIPAQQTLSSVSQLLLNGKEDQAEKLLKSIDSAVLPEQIEASRQISWASLRIRQYRFEDALAALDKADAQQVEAPVADELRAMAQNGLGRYPEAVVSAQKYIGKIGESASIEQHLGDAFEGMKKPAEAAAAYRKGLDVNPDSYENMQGLRRVLPAGQKQELGVRLARCANKHIPFSYVAGDANEANDLESLQALTDVYAQTQPNDVLLEYYQAAVLAQKKQYIPAAAMLKANFPRASANDRGIFNSEFVRFLIEAGDPVRAYQEAPQSAAAFRQVANSLRARNDLLTLRKLVEQRRSDYPSDYWIDYYEGALHARNKEFAAACASYFKAMDAATDKEHIGQFRYAAVRASFHAGKALEAYKRLRSREAFEQIAYLYSAQYDADGLNQLLAEAQAGDTFDETDIAYWRAQMAYWKRDYARAAAILMDIHGKLVADNPNHWRATDTLIRCLVHERQFDEAAAEARSLTTDNTPPKFDSVMISANRGDVATASTAIDELLKDDDDYDLESFYADPEIGPALRSPAFAKWRETHPEPKPQTQPSTRPVSVYDFD